MALDLFYINSGRVPARRGVTGSGQVGPRGGAVLGWSGRSREIGAIDRLSIGVIK